jgi:predicted TIM-barrel enzyme
MMNSISGKASSAIRENVRKDKVVVGMIHRPAFPGSPHYPGADMESVHDACVRDGKALIEGGMHVPKPGDIGPDTPAFMSALTERTVRATAVPIRIDAPATAPVRAFAVLSLKGEGVWWDPVGPSRVRAFRTVAEHALEG